MGRLGDADDLRLRDGGARRRRRDLCAQRRAGRADRRLGARRREPPAVRAGRGPAPASSSMSISRGRIRSSTARRSIPSARRSAPSWRARARSRPIYVVPVPDSGVPAAIGYAQESGIPFELGIIRSHYVGRTFIQPGDQVRHLGVKLKHNANSALIRGKRLVLIDDSIVRGTTSLKIVQMMREAGAAEVHMRIASPPTRHTCFYGVDTPERTKLLAAQMDVDGDERAISAPTASPSSRSTASTARSARTAATTAAPQPLRRLLLRRLSDHADRSGRSGAARPAHPGSSATPDAGSLDGKLALVTGASRGIGAATAEALAGAGAHVILTARTATDLEAVEDRIHVDRRLGDDRAARPDRKRQHRPAGAGDRRALGEARHSGAQRRDARHARRRLADRRQGVQPDPDSECPCPTGYDRWHLIRCCGGATAARLIGDHLQRRAGAAGLLGRLWRVQGCA